MHLRLAEFTLFIIRSVRRFPRAPREGTTIFEHRRGKGRMSSNGWQGKGDPMEIAVEQWLIANGVNYRRADDMKARLDFFLPDFNVYIECKQFHTPRTNEQLQRATDIIVVQGRGSLKFLDSLIARGRVNG